MHLIRLIQDLSQLAFLLLVWNPPIKVPLSLHLFDSEQVQYLWLFQHTVACTTMISPSLEYVVPIIKKEINKCLFHMNTSNCWKQGIITHTDRAESKQAYQWGKSKKLTSWYFYICQLQRHYECVAFWQWFSLVLRCTREISWTVHQSRHLPLLAPATLNQGSFPGPAHCILHKGGDTILYTVTIKYI